MIRLNKSPLYGAGIASIVTSFSNTAKTHLQEQIYEFNTAINSAFNIYCNRLKAMELYKNFNFIKGQVKNQTGGVWNIFFDFEEHKHQDKILTDMNNLLKNLWKRYNQVRTLLDERILRDWSYVYTNQVCRYGVYIDLSTIVLSLLSICALLGIFVGIWMNEYIVRCIIYEESQFLNIEKYRFDWI